MIGNRNLAPKPHCQAEHQVPNELSVALTLRDERMKQGGSVRADYTAVVDGDRRYVEVSDSFCRLVEYRREELIGRRYDDLTAPGASRRFPLQAPRSHRRYE